MLPLKKVERKVGYADKEGDDQEDKDMEVPQVMMKRLCLEDKKGVALVRSSTNGRDVRMFEINIQPPQVKLTVYTYYHLYYPFVAT